MDPDVLIPSASVEGDSAVVIDPYLEPHAAGTTLRGAGLKLLQQRTRNATATHARIGYERRHARHAAVATR
jgi:hypothetical protein